MVVAVEERLEEGSEGGSEGPWEAKELVAELERWLKIGLCSAGAPRRCSGVDEAERGGMRLVEMLRLDLWGRRRCAPYSEAECGCVKLFEVRSGGSLGDGTSNRCSTESGAE